MIRGLLYCQLAKKILSVSIFKSIRFNLHYFPAKDAIRFPAIIYKNVSLYNMGGDIFIEEPIKTGIIQIGAKNVSIIGKDERTIWDCQGEIHLIGKTNSYLQQKHFFGAKSIGYIMDLASSVDIDNSIDLNLAKILLENDGKGI